MPQIGSGHQGYVDTQSETILPQSVRFTPKGCENPKSTCGCRCYEAWVRLLLVRLAASFFVRKEGDCNLMRRFIPVLFPIVILAGAAGVAGAASQGFTIFNAIDQAVTT